MAPGRAQIPQAGVQISTLLSRHTALIHYSQYTVLQSHNVVSAYFASKQMLPFGFAREYISPGWHSLFHVDAGKVCVELEEEPSTNKSSRGSHRGH